MSEIEPKGVIEVKRVVIFLGGMLSLLFGLVSFASEELRSGSWDLERDKKGVQIYTRDIKGSPYDQVKGVTFINARLSSLVALVRDTEACPEWADLCAESRVHESLSETEHYIYTLNDIPWPASNRDVLAHVTWEQNPDSLQVIMHSKATAGLIKKTKGVVRLTEANASWIFKPVGEGIVEVTTMAHIDPGGPLPGWMTNLFLVDSPYNTLLKMKQAVSKDKYVNAEISFIREPAE